MPITLSIKSAPDDVVERLRARAKRNHRSLNGELLAIIERAANELQPASNGLHELQAYVRTLDLPRVSESTDIIRRLRDGRHGDTWQETGEHDPQGD